MDTGDAARAGQHQALSGARGRVAHRRRSGCWPSRWRRSGLYGVIGYSVSRRVREIGIRKALGAKSGEVVGMVMKEGMVLVVVGGAIGAGLAALGSQAISSVLYVGPFDVLSFAMAFGVLALVAALANAVPAWRASRVDAMVALRHD